MTFTTTRNMYMEAMGCITVMNIYGGVIRILCLLIKNLTGKTAIGAVVMDGHLPHWPVYSRFYRPMIRTGQNTSRILKIWPLPCCPYKEPMVFGIQACTTPPILVAKNLPAHPCLYMA